MDSIGTAIKNKKWYTCSADTFDGPVTYKIKVLSFEKVNMDEVDEPENIGLDDQGIFWILRVEVTNIGKAPMAAWHVLNQTNLTDNDGCSFKAVEDDHLVYDSEYAMKNKVRRFHGMSSIPPLLPKVPASGALIYLLPDEDKVQYHLSIEEGKICN